MESNFTQNRKLLRITTVPISLKVLLRQQLRFMSHHYEVLAVSSAGKELDDVQKEEGVRTAIVTMTRSITPINDLKALWQLYKLFRKEKPLIVHTHTPKAGLLGMLASRLAGVPIRIHTIAGLPLMENNGIKRFVLESAERITYGCAKYIYPNSRNLAAFIIENNFCKKDKVKVLGNGSSNGINSEWFQRTPDVLTAAKILKQKLSISDTDFVYVFIGRLVKDKGIQELVEAFMQVQKTINTSKLLLVGPFEQELDPLPESVLQAINNNSSIIQVDFQQDVRPFLALSNILVFPSYREGFPNVPMQAGCMDLPSIVTNINGCNEIIENGKNGLIVPVKDTYSLVQAMENIANDKCLYSHLQLNARPMITERFDQQYFWNLLLREYQEMQKKYENVSKLSQAFA